MAHASMLQSVSLARSLRNVSLAYLTLWLTFSAAALQFVIDYSVHPDTALLRASDEAILSPGAQVDLKNLRRAGQHFYAYISVVEIAPDATYKNHPALKKVPVLARNDAWKSVLVDVSSPDWRSFVVDNLAAQAQEKGFDGFFLDTAESVEILAADFPSRATQFREGLRDLVQALKRRHPEQKILMNRGLSVWEICRPYLDGVLIESLFQTCDVKTRNFHDVDATSREELLKIALAIQQSGLNVYVADYVDPLNRPLAQADAKRIAAYGFHPFITTPELDGRSLAPLREAPRSILALFGNLELDAERSIPWPVDCFIAKQAQLPLEWLGYEVDYINPNTDMLQSPLPAKYAAIVMDRWLQVHAGKQAALADWLIRQKHLGMKIIFLGDIPVKDREARRHLIQEFGMRGSGDTMSLSNEPQAVLISDHMNFEAKVVLSTSLFFDLQAPQGATIALALSGINRKGQTNRFDPIYTAPWGGMALDPYMTFRRPDFDEHWLFDPFDFFSRALDRGSWPAPDCTTRDGTRIFFAHIDGDGFGNRSTVDPLKRSSEIVYERVLQKYPFPVSCSIIEAEARGWLEGQNADDEKQLMALGRKIFSDAKVEAASHTYSHPFFWADDDKEASFYDLPCLRLAPPHAVKTLDLNREINGSIQFLNDCLLPPGKKVQLFLWSGDCRPTPTALRLTRQLGIENMNGGDTIISRKHPSVSKVAPRSMTWDGELQIYAMHQNENVYRERWQMDGKIDMPFFGGFAHAADGFVRTESPRRLKPVNIYYHWYNGSIWVPKPRGLASNPT